MTLLAQQRKTLFLIFLALLFAGGLYTMAMKDRTYQRQYFFYHIQYPLQELYTILDEQEKLQWSNPRLALNQLTHIHNNFYYVQDDTTFPYRALNATNQVYFKRITESLKDILTFNQWTTTQQKELEDLKRMLEKANFTPSADNGQNWIDFNDDIEILYEQLKDKKAAKNKK